MHKKTIMRVITTQLNKIFPLVLLIGLVGLSACQENTSKETVDEAATAVQETSQNVASTTAKEPTDRKSATETDKPLVGSRPAFVPPKADQAPLTLGISNERVKNGAEVCLKVQVVDFDQLLSMQYSVRWDPKMLQFKRTDGYQLAGMSAANFGAHRAAEGILTSVWIDNSLQGVSLANASPIYQICFEAIGATGQSTEVNLSDGPTPFEVVNLKQEVLDLKGVAGRVTIN